MESGLSVSMDWIISSCDLPPHKYQRDTAELPAFGRTRRKEPLAQGSWCCQGLMAQISSAEDLQDLLKGIKKQTPLIIRQNSGERCSCSQHSFSKVAARFHPMY